MLRPLLLTFLNWYFEDLLVCNVIIQVVFFLLCYYWAQSSWWQFWVQALVGVALAMACRLAQEHVLRRSTPATVDAGKKLKRAKGGSESAAQLLAARVYSESDVPPPTRLGPRLWPRHNDDTWLWGVLCVLSTAAGLLVYNVRVHGGGTDSLQTPFSVGVLISVLLVWLALLTLEGIAYTLQMGQADFKLWGLYPGCGLVVACVAALDMLAFLQGYYLVLILAGLLAGCWALGWMVWRLMTPAHYRTALN